MLNVAMTVWVMWFSNADIQHVAVGEFVTETECMEMLPVVKAGMERAYPDDKTMGFICLPFIRARS
jgi:hypothetical protein